MTQVPLAPPPPTGGPLDGWLYLLWRRLTQAGQILWGSITPGTSADVAAVVTDKTGSPGSLVFSGNPTLDGVTVSGIATISASSSSAVLTVTQTGTGNSFLVEDSASPDSSPFVIDNSGYMLHGYTAKILAANGTPLTQFYGVAGLNNIGLFGYRSSDGAGPTLEFSRSRSSTIGTHTIVNNGDYIGKFSFAGSDGTNFIEGASVRAEVDGTPGTNDMPVRLLFNTTADGSSSAIERMRITSAGVITLGGTSSTPALKVTPVASQARWIEVTGATSSGNPALGVSGGILAISASVAITGVVSTSGYTVATLPAGTVGQRAYVTDALAPAYGVAVAGAGAVTIPVFYNGAAWICA